MDFPDYDFKYRYLYPLLGLVLYYILTIITILTLNKYFDMLKLNVFTALLILAFLVESMVRFNAELKLKIPVVTFLLEFILYYLALLFTTGSYGVNGIYGFRNPSLWVVFLLSVVAWFHVNELAGLFNVFRVDCEKIYVKSSGRWSFDEFRRLLDYPSTWKKISKKISFINIYLLIIWAALRILNPYVVVGTIIFLIIEIFLLSLAYLDKKTIDWHIQGIERPVLLKEGWYRFIVIILILALSFAEVLPYNYSPLPLQRIGRWLNSLLPEMKPGEMPTPERPERQIPTGEIARQEQAEGINYMNIIFLVLQIILFTSFGIIILAFIIFLVKLEFKKVKNLPDFFKKFSSFFRSLVKEIFSRVKQLNITIRSSRHIIKKRRRKKEDTAREIDRIKNIKIPGNLRSMVIIIYNSMLKLLSIRGQGKKQDQTPYEYSRMIGDQYIDISEDINHLTDFYVEIVYSDHSLSKSTASLVKKIWAKVKKAL